MILNELLQEMQDNVKVEYSDVMMNNLHRSTEDVIKFDDSDMLKFELDGSWFPASQMKVKSQPPVFNTKLIKLPR